MNIAKYVDVIISLKSGDTSGSSTNGVNMDSLNVTPNNLSNSTAVVPTAPERKLVPDIFYRLQPGQYSPRGILFTPPTYST